MSLTEDEKRVLEALSEGRPKGVYEISSATGLPPDRVRWALGWLSKKGFVEEQRREKRVLVLSEKGRRALSDGLPEERVLEACGPECSLSRLSRILDGETLRIGVGQLLRLGAKVERGVLRIPDVDSIKDKIGRLKEALKAAQSGMPEGREAEALLSRGLLAAKRVVESRFSITEAGSRALGEASGGIGQLTPEVIASGAWRELGFRPYDVTAPYPAPLPGKPHPFVELIERLREIFLELGFEEADADLVVSAFWNMDALFTPQDHPAREMQDTFYLSRPSRIPVEDEEYMRRVAEVHESVWGGRWSRGEAERALLRTHMTVSSILALYRYRDREPPYKVFSIGRVFRREAIDPTHLPEFTQIDGIVVEEGVSVRELMGMISEFLTKLGIRDFKFRPSYFPYTEPSLEVVARVGGKEIELLGSGLFRPEVLRPLGIRVPVLAWGGGLERLAMALFGLEDIREIYNNDVRWLRWAKLP